MTIVGFRIRIGVLVLSLMLAGSFNLLASQPGYHSTKLNEIEKWRDLKGGVYTVGMGRDSDGSLVPLAIYDKTFPSPYYGRFWRSAFLGAIGVGKVSLNRLDYLSKKKKAGKQIYNLLFSFPSESKIEEGVYEKDWWRSPTINWKPGQKPNFQGEPPFKIRLNQIDFQSGEVLKKNNYGSKLQRLFKSFISYIDDGFDVSHKSSFEDLVNKSAFYRLHDGNYKLITIGKTNSNPPKKIIDLQGYLTSYKNALMWGVFSNGAKALVSLIPIYGLVNAANAIMERFFTLIEVIYLTRHAMALNLIFEAIEGNENSPFYNVLDELQLDRAVIYLKRSNTMISALLANGFRKTAKMTEKIMIKIKKKKAQSINYLQKHNYTIYPFDNSFYTLGVRRNPEGVLRDLKVFSLIKKKSLLKKPHEVVDFLHPKKQITKRNILEAILIGSEFLELPLVFVASIFKILFKEIFIREVQRQQIYEAGFKGHMIHSSVDLENALAQEGFTDDEISDKVDLVYKVIYNRLLNPIELTREEEVEYRIQSEYWMSLKDPSYIPWDNGCQVVLDN